MHISIASALVAICGSTLATCYNVGPTIKTDLLAAKALLKLTAYKHQQGNNATCNLQNVAIRREWGSLSGAQRIAYTNAVKCLMAKPSMLDPVQFPGAKSRFDDFVVTHVSQTFEIHATASFLSWHRYFTWAYEQALRKECGYNGYQPYWNWGKYAHDPIGSPIFDGTATSMSGNGAYYPHNCTNALPSGLNCIPPGNGGGCITSGPFVNMTVNLGPIAPSLAVDNNPLAPSLYAHNPRCLRRDVSSWVSSQWSTENETYDLIQGGGYNTIAAFQDRMQGDFGTGYFGVHTAGHYTIGGDPGGDFFTSPGDPAFYLHHAQIDRVWWIWQNQDPANRTVGVAGPKSLFDPTGPQGTLEDPLYVSPSEDTITIRKAMSTVALEGSPFCYIYI